MKLRTLLPTVVILALWVLWPQAQVTITPGQVFNFNGGVPTLNLIGANYVSFPPGAGIRLASNMAIGWSTTTDSTGAAGTQITRVADGEISLGSTPVTFATLGTPINGTIAYCTDCTEVTPASCPATQASCICAGSGAGAFARRVNAVWYCTF